MRVRLIYEKRGGACFVPHIALAQVFTRSAKRARIELEMTQGFSPRAKISFGPELPAGVVALNELVDMYTVEDYPAIVVMMNEVLPEGFRISRAINIPEGSPNLGKSCTHAEYLLRTTNGQDIEYSTRMFWYDSITSMEYIEDWLHLFVENPAQNPIGGLVRNLVAKNLISGWHEINVVRVSVGRCEIYQGA